MTTKEQERKALEQIRKIVEGLGNNSYIGTAFEGCFEIAEENIENDSACSMKERREAAEAAEDSLRERVAQLQKTIAEDNAVIERNAKYIDELEERNNDLLRRLRQTEETAMKNLESLTSYQTKASQQEEEIIRLKAKLYDLITK